MNQIDVSALLDFSQELPTKLRQGLSIAGLNLVQQANVRVHDQGIDSSGNKITSTHKVQGSTRKRTQYSEGYAAFRRSKGRQTSFIDLEFEGQLRSAYQMRLTNDGFQTGYFTGDAARKMHYAEQRHGSPIIDPTEKEIEGVLIDITEAIFQ